MEKEQQKKFLILVSCLVVLALGSSGAAAAYYYYYVYKLKQQTTTAAVAAEQKQQTPQQNTTTSTTPATSATPTTSTTPATVTSLFALPVSGATPSALIGEGGTSNLAYLDRQNIACGSTSALSNVSFSNEGNLKGHYNYTCSDATNPGSITDQNTKSNDLGTGRDLIYLNRHSVSCPPDSVINRMHFVNEGGNKGHYNYGCLSTPGLGQCTTKETATVQQGGPEYLDRAPVTCPANQALSQYYINDKGNNQYSISYTCCNRSS